MLPLQYMENIWNRMRRSQESEVIQGQDRNLTMSDLEERYEPQAEKALHDALLVYEIESNLEKLKNSSDAEMNGILETIIRHNPHALPDTIDAEDKDEAVAFLKALTKKVIQRNEKAH
jgi:hypothetical protein